MKLSNSALIGAVALALAACASGPQPSEQMASARSAVSQAGTMPVGPEGSVELQKARAKLQLAEAALQEKIWERAKRFAEQAEMDARLAMAWSEAEKGKVKAAQAQDQLVAEMRQSNQPVAETTPQTGAPAAAR